MTKDLNFILELMADPRFENLMDYQKEYYEKLKIRLIKEEQIKEKHRALMKAKGAKEFEINGKIYLARNFKNAMRKAKNENKQNHETKNHIRIGNSRKHCGGNIIPGGDISGGID